MKIKPVYFLAACAAPAVFVGAGCATSVYFYKVYSRAEMPAAYDVAADDRGQLVAAPAAAEGTPVVELDGLGRLNLGPVFEGRDTGEFFDVQLCAGDRTAAAQGLEVRDNAEQIAAAVRTASGPDDAQVWAGDTVSVESCRGGWRFAIEAKTGFDAGAAFDPYSGQHTILTEQSWFNREMLSALRVSYKGADVTGVSYTSRDGGYTLVSTIPVDGYIQSPLDVIIAEAAAGQYLRVDRVLEPNSDNPLVVLSDPNGNTAVFVARRTDGGGYLVQRLLAPKSQLPSDLF